MITLGAACLILALVLAIYSALAALIGTRGDRRFVDSSRRAVYAFAALLTICVVIIEAAFARTDLSLQVVADHSSTTTPIFYRFTAMWSSQEGSLLLWAWVLSLTSSAVLFATRNKHRELAPWATAVLMGLGAFFTGLMLFNANPFARLSPVPPEGVGLEPLLRHPAPPRPRPPGAGGGAPPAPPPPPPGGGPPPRRCSTRATSSSRPRSRSRSQR